MNKSKKIRSCTIGLHHVACSNNNKNHNNNEKKITIKK